MTDMQQQKRPWILCTCCLLFVVGLSILWMTNHSDTHNYHTDTSHKLRSLASTMPLFGNNLTEEVVLECITGEVIGIRPRQHDLDTVDFRQQRVTRSHKELDSHRKAVFDDIYHNRIWGTNTSVVFSVSGGGATVNFARNVMVALHVIIDQLKRYLGVERIRLLDVPCGDMQWMSQFLQSCPGIEYTGVDIVADIISRHRMAYHKRPWKFLNLDIVSQPINVSDYDLIVTRMMMQHLPESDVFRILHNFSNITNQQHRPVFLLATTFSNNDVNAKPADSKHNLEISPYRLQPPLCLLRDGPTSMFYFMGLWRLPLRVVAESSCSKPLAVTTSLSKIPMYSCINWTLTMSRT